MTKISHSILLAIILFSISTPSRAESVWASVPVTNLEFMNVYGGSEASAGEIEALNQLKISGDPKRVYLKTKSDLLSRLPDAPAIVYLIGHNHDGRFYFPSGEYLEIESISAEAVKHNKEVVFLTCNGKRHTDFPAPRLKVTFSSAFEMARKIEDGWKEAQVVPVPSVSPKEERDANHPHVPPWCRQALSSRPRSAAAARTGFRRYAKRQIFRSELKNALISTPVRISVAVTATGALIFSISEDE